MARRSSKKSTDHGQNATSSTVATRSVFVLQSPPALAPKPDPFNDMGQHDRRRFNPTTVYSGPASTTKKAATQKVSGRKLSPFTAFKIPKQVALCVRRKIRKQVIHALKINKSRAGKSRKNRNAYSNVRC